VRLEPFYRIRFSYPEGWRTEIGGGWHGYGRAYPVGRRQVVGAVFHSSDDARYRRLNDVICVCAGEVRASAGAPTELVVDIAELIWEAISPEPTASPT
jgi:hypothetical protein